MPGLEDELGDVVRKARTGLELDLAQVAVQVGLTEREMRGIEVYTFHPDEPQVRRLAELLKLRPDQLWDLAEDSWSAPDVPWQIGHIYTIDVLTNDYPEHCYVITNPRGACLIVDPGDEADRVVREATHRGRTPAAILVTHAHGDHTGAVVPVQRATGVPVWVHQADAHSVSDVPGDFVHTFTGDETLPIEGFDLRVLHTPGHTPGSSTYIVTAGTNSSTASTGNASAAHGTSGGDDDDTAVAAFCGDTLFAGSAGNGRAGYDALLHSVREKLGRLPGQTVFYPGHGPATTLANEQARNPFLTD